MKTKKTYRKFFAVWDHRKEIDFLNKQSQKGWQLYKGGAFSTKFEKDESLTYRYQIDYNPRLDNHLEYQGYFEDQGWEYISSSFNGWHFFRKIYDKDKPADEYEIYTDSSSRSEMNSKIKKFFIPIAILEGIIFLLNLITLVIKPSLRYLIGTIVFGVFTFFFTRAIFLMDKSFNLPVEKQRTRMELWTVVIIFLAICMTMFTGFKSNIKLESDYDLTLDEGIDIEMASFKNKLPDIYYLDTIISSDVPATVSIENQQGDVFYKSNNSREKDMKVFLRRGNYKIMLRSDRVSNGKGKVNIRLELD